MSEAEDLRRVGHVVERAQWVRTWTKGRQRRLDADPMTYDAVQRCFVVMGEAASRTTHAFRQEHPEVPWNRLIAFGRLLMEGFDRIKVEDVEAAVADVPALLKALKPLAKTTLSRGP